MLLDPKEIEDKDNYRILNKRTQKESLITGLGLKIQMKHKGFLKKFEILENESETKRKLEKDLKARKANKKKENQNPEDEEPLNNTGDDTGDDNEDDTGDDTGEPKKEPKKKQKENTTNEKDSFFNKPN